MMRRSCIVLFFAMLASGMMTGQDPATYLDEYIVKVKPDKRAEFDAINKKIAALNRNNKGDTWLAFENTYGENNVVTFVSQRSGFGDAQKSFDVFMGALAKPGGMPAAQKMMQDFNNTIMSARSELRRRRPDLGTNVPSSLAEYAALLGKARFLYVVTVRIRPGRASFYEDQMKMVRDARAKAGQKQAWLVSQSVVGLQGISYYITRPLTSLGEIDGSPTLSEVLRTNGYDYAGYQNRSAENTLSTEITIGRYLPELSNPPAEITAIDPAFWTSKPMPAPKKVAAESTK